ncbi:alpha/beta fold hydrolase [Nocardioides marmoriginsengisoli]|uniref:Alpha/beta fold hydrolase n=1 Tax=Nocardioides marmoriginsengisoli TaxID=661483 RepID=A0A3N0CAJ8_9ACTN|nr:alpha/beta hydrolase [Nocardioides marmoriginsengisoli]RNL60502.1 alpha/beta fold hydrolase [Nocardioides marmoriginsengisoli]
MTLVDVNGIRLNITDSGAPAGRPDAPTLVMGHGLLFSTTMWRHQIEALRSSYRCVAIDWRGQGATPPTESGYDMDTLYDDAAALIEHLDVGPVHYLGLSMGGFVGLRLGARRPDLIRSLTLIDTSAGPEDPEKVSKYRLLATIYGVLGMKPLLGQVAPIMFTPAFMDTDAGKATVDTWTAELATQQRKGVKKAIRGVTDRAALGDEIRGITAPTLVIVGSEDVATPVAKAEAIAAAISGSRLDILAGVGHVSTLEDPARINACVQEFLAGLG